jgi:hypothetical protein
MVRRSCVPYTCSFFCFFLHKQSSIAGVSVHCLGRPVRATPIHRTSRYHNIWNAVLSFVIWSLQCSYYPCTWKLVQCAKFPRCDKIEWQVTTPVNAAHFFCGSSLLLFFCTVPGARWCIRHICSRLQNSIAVENFVVVESAVTQALPFVARYCYPYKMLPRAEEQKCMITGWGTLLSEHSSYVQILSAFPTRFSQWMFLTCIVHCYYKFGAPLRVQVIHS